MGNYDLEYQRSVSDPEGFWAEQAQKLSWFSSPKEILSQDENGVDRWFADGILNTAYLALDYHVEQGRGDQAAIIYDSPVTGQKQVISYRALTDDVAQAAGGLADLGVGKGDTVLIYMPMVPEAVIGMLACARLGAIHSVVFGGFAAHELAIRIDDAKPKVVLSASCGIEIDRVIAYKPLLDKAIASAAHKPGACVILQRPQATAALNTGRDIDWRQWVATASPVACTPVKATDPLYILYTSGTTGTPKGIVRDNGGHAVAMRYSMAAIYDLHPGEVFWAASDVGWVVGHSYIVYAPLISGCTTVLYEGKPVRTPDAGAFWRVVSEYSVKAIFSAPTAFRAIKKEDPQADLARRHDLSSLQSIFLAGERLDPPTYHWLEQTFHRPIVDHWWQTETGWAIAANMLGLERKPTKPGSATLPAPGYQVQITDDQGQPLAAGKQGNILLKLPLPPGCSPTIWKNFDRFRQGYLAAYPGYYLSGDGGYIDDQGYVFVMGRTDDIINVAGHRFSTGQIEEVLASHPAVAECAVIGVNNELKGQTPIGLVLLKDSTTVEPARLEQELVRSVRDEIGAVACLQTVYPVKRLPKTRSGKILRKLIRQIANGEHYVTPSTIEDPESLKEIAVILRR
ncbi:MAG: propionyl-CoA synthetase [Pseudomonadales bacterium]|nr:propionyl-CoA synthetase [Pseudomonadales bacterium]